MAKIIVINNKKYIKKMKIMTIITFLAMLFVFFINRSNAEELPPLPIIPPITPMNKSEEKRFLPPLPLPNISKIPNIDFSVDSKNKKEENFFSKKDNIFFLNNKSKKKKYKPYMIRRAAKIPFNVKSQILPKTIYKDIYTAKNRHLPQAFDRQDFVDNMIIATKNGNLNGMRALNKRGVSLRIKNKQGKTLLEIAKDNGHSKIVRWLKIIGI